MSDRVSGAGAEFDEKKTQRELHYIMAIRVALNHKTSYQYDRPVTLSPHVIRLRPAPHCRTPILSYSLRVLPEPHFLNWQQDPYSNHLGRVVFLKPATFKTINRSN